MSTVSSLSPSLVQALPSSAATVLSPSSLLVVSTSSSVLSASLPYARPTVVSAPFSSAQDLSLSQLLRVVRDQVRAEMASTLSSPTVLSAAGHVALSSSGVQSFVPAMVSGAPPLPSADQSSVIVTSSQATVLPAQPPSLSAPSSILSGLLLAYHVYSFGMSYVCVLVRVCHIVLFLSASVSACGFVGPLAGGFLFMYA